MKVTLTCCVQAPIVSSEKLALRIACAVTGFSKLFVPVSLASDLLSLSSCPFCVVCG